MNLLSRTLTKPLNNFFRVVSSLVYLFLDNFSTNEAAPMASPHTSDVGTMTLVQTNAQFSTSAGEFIIPVQSVLDVTGATSSWRATDSFARGNGLGYFMREQQVNVSAAVANIIMSINSATPISTANAVMSLRISNSGFLGMLQSPTVLTINTYYWWAIVVTNFGGIVYAKIGSTWELISVRIGGTPATPLFFGGYQTTATAARNGKSDKMFLSQLGFPFTDEYGASDFHSTSPSVGDTFVGQADGIVFMQFDTAGIYMYAVARGDVIAVYSISAAGVLALRHTYSSAAFNNTATGVKLLVRSASVVDLAIRYTDDNNCWILRWNTTANTEELIERNAGIETVRASSAFNIGTIATTNTNLSGWGFAPKMSVTEELDRWVS